KDDQRKIGERQDHERWFPLHDLEERARSFSNLFGDAWIHDVCLPLAKWALTACQAFSYWAAAASKPLRNFGPGSLAPATVATVHSCTTRVWKACRSPS